MIEPYLSSLDIDSPPLLKLTGAVKLREQPGTRFELRIPEFRIDRGEFVSLVGESGCGKSTLLDLLALISSPDRCDRFRFAPLEREIDLAALWQRNAEAELAHCRRRHLGYVLQTGGLLPYLKVYDNLRLPCRLNGLRGVEERIQAMAERIGVADCLNRLPERLSGGQRQRVAILRALVHRPALVLADEPTAAVDRARARAIVADFRALARAGGMAIVMVTHDLELVEGVADRSYGFRLESEGAGQVVSCCEERG